MAVRSPCPDQQHCAICATGVMCCLDTVTSGALSEVRIALLSEIGHAPHRSTQPVAIEVTVSRETEGLTPSLDDDDTIAVFTQSPEEVPRIEVSVRSRRR